MREHAGDAPTMRAQAAMDRGDWQGALEPLLSLQGNRPLSSAELELLAQAAYGSGDLEGAVEAWERLHTRGTASGDIQGAARAATTVALLLMVDTGLMAPVRGWATRAERLLADQPESDTNAWLAVVHTYERFMSGDMSQAGHWARRAIDLGDRHDAPAPAAIGRLATARLAILDGHVDEGLHLLDEAATATMSGELDPFSVGIVYCELICAMQGLAQYDRAEQWTTAMETWRRESAVGTMSGRCRVHRAEILCLRGSCDEAEEEALHACEELRPWMRREYGWPLTELGRIRLRKGDLEGAEEAFLAAHENGWDPQPGLALLRLAQGDVSAASSLIAQSLDQPSNVPSKERPPYGGLRRAPLLDAQTEIAVAAGDVDTARRASEELSTIAQTFRSRALMASAALARGRVALASGEVSTGEAESREAVAAWSEVGAPYEASVARLVLAEALRAGGGDDAALMELRAARSAFDRIGARRLADETALAARRVLGEDSHRSPTPAPAASVAVAVAVEAVSESPGDGVFRRDGDTRSVVYGGLAVVLRDLKGMRYIAHLLAAAGREFHVLELVAAERGVPLVIPSVGSEQMTAAFPADAGPVIDDQAKEAYRRRLADIDDDIDEATRLGDAERVAMAEADRDYLVRELSRAFGLGGKARRLDSTAERARTSVTRSIRYALERLAEHHSVLAEHLRATLRTGTYCGYFPDPRVPPTWQL